MESASVVDAARLSLGSVGAYLPLPFTSAPPIDLQREAARRLEGAGYRTAWVNDPVGGKDPFVQVALLLAVTERMTLGTSIANIWSRAPQTTHAAAALLSEAYPGRLVLGLGAGYPQQAAAVGREFGRPLAAMRDYLERMTAPTMTPAPEAPYPRIIAANGPKMLALAAEMADGALPAGLPPAYTARARETLGPGKLLVVAMSVITDTTDREAAHAKARAAVAASLGRTMRPTALTWLGYTDEQVAELDDDLVNALVAHGDPDSIATLATAHRDAGADHVILLPSGAADLMTGVEQLEHLAPTMLGIR
jgi:probable F420-dependent oxidoreductase